MDCGISSFEAADRAHALGIDLIIVDHHQIDPDKVIKRLTYHHPLYTPAGVAAQQQQGEVNGINRTYFCGAYWRYGFHEDGVVSALEALKHFSQWQQQHAQRDLSRVA